VFSKKKNVDYIATLQVQNLSEKKFISQVSITKLFYVTSLAILSFNSILFIGFEI